MQNLWYTEEDFEDQQFPKEMDRIIINSFQSFIIYISSQKLQGKLQTHNIGTGNYIKKKHNIKTRAT
jgi:hypothetical protein